MQILKSINLGPVSAKPLFYMTSKDLFLCHVDHTNNIGFEQTVFCKWITLQSCRFIHVRCHYRKSVHKPGSAILEMNFENLFEYIGLLKIQWTKHDTFHTNAYVWRNQCRCCNGPNMTLLHIYALIYKEINGMYATFFIHIKISPSVTFGPARSMDRICAYGLFFQGNVCVKSLMYGPS